MTDGILDRKVDCLLLGVLLGSFYGFKLGLNEGIVLGKSLGALDGLILNQFDGIWIGSSECSADVNTHGKS